MTSRRKKVLIHSNSHAAFTGFGKNCKNILKYLYGTGKYDLYELANGSPWSDTGERCPWTFFGSLPTDAATINRIKSNPQEARAASYGLHQIDKAIKKIKPDVYIGIEDIWAFSETVHKPWWNKINCMIWTTLDSLPILPEAIKMAPHIKNYYVWSPFAEKAMNKLGIDHVKTLRGSIDESNFYRLPDSTRDEIRKRHGLSNSSFIIGYVFRNQLRKTVSDLIVGFRFFKDRYPESNAKLLLHTNFSEGWDIPRILSETGVSSSDVLTTYVCSKCKKYSVNSFVGQNQTCPHCGNKNCFSTTSVSNGVSEKQLNEVYNLMDVYVHPFTSGGQEIPLQEAKLTELITVTTNYTCGEEMCSNESGGLPIAWSPYREIGTQFIKASSSPTDICNKIQQVFLMPKAERLQMGLRARNYVIENFSFDSVGKKLEKIIDEMPEIDFNSIELFPSPNPDFKPKQKYDSDVSFVKDIYKNLLGRNPDSSQSDINSLVSKIRAGVPPERLFSEIKKASIIELKKLSRIKISDLIDENGRKRIAVVVPNDSYLALICSYFIKSLNKKYADSDLYIFADEKLHYLFVPYSDLIHKICPLVDGCLDQTEMEGRGNFSGYFDMCFIPEHDNLSLAHISHNGKDL